MTKSGPDNRQPSPVAFYGTVLINLHIVGETSQDREMGQRTKPRIIGASGSIISGLWGAYATWTTASQLPADAGWLAKMLADPPIYLPWLAFALFVMIAAWAFWPTSAPAKDDGTSGQQSSQGPNSPVVGSVGGNFTQIIHPPIATRHPGPPVGRVLGKPIRDRTDVMNAALYMIFLEWNRASDDLNTTDQIVLIAAKLKLMTQDACDGHLAIFIKRQRHGGTHVDPGSDYWGNHHLDYDADGEVKAKANSGLFRATEGFVPMVRKSDIERLYGPSEPQIFIV